jgi:hypothetical protein
MTRLGQFSPTVCYCLVWAVLGKLQNNLPFWGNFFHGKSYVLILTKNGDFLQIPLVTLATTTRTAQVTKSGPRGAAFRLPFPLGRFRSVAPDTTTFTRPFWPLVTAREGGVRQRAIFYERGVAETLIQSVPTIGMYIFCRRKTPF